MKMAMIELGKRSLDECSKEYLREKGNYEHAVNALCRYLQKTGFDMDTHIIYRVTDRILKNFLISYMEERDCTDAKEAVLIGKMADILNRILSADVDIMSLWPELDVRCGCGTLCHLIDAKTAYSMSAVYEKGLQNRYFYRCPVCGAMVGTHMGTNIPYGTPVNREGAKMRIKTHEKMEEVIHEKNLEKTDVYQYLSNKFPDMDKEKVHVGNFDLSSCQDTMRYLDLLKKEGRQQISMVG